jgi:hypothetical protein
VHQGPDATLLLLLLLPGLVLWACSRGWS